MGQLQVSIFLSFAASLREERPEISLKMIPKIDL